MTTVQTILTGLAVMAAALYAERGPDPYSGFGPVVCMVEPDVPGPSFRMTIDDQPDEMVVWTSLSVIYLPRDQELTDADTHVAALTDGAHTIAVTLDRDLRTSVTVIGGPNGLSIGSGQCERI